MPIGQPYPPAGTAAPQVASPGAAAATPTLSALEAWSGSGADTQVQASVFSWLQTPAPLPGLLSVQAQRFEATGLVVDNRTPGPVLVGVGRKPVWNAGGFDYLVGPGEVLAVRVQPTTNFWLRQAAPWFGANPTTRARRQPSMPGVLTAYLLAGAAAALIPSYQVTARPGFATLDVLRIVAGATPTTPAISWASTADPFGAGPVLLDRVVFTHSTAGAPKTKVLLIPLAAGSVFRLTLPLGQWTDLGGVMVGGIAGVTTPTKLAPGGLTANEQATITFIYRPQWEPNFLDPNAE